ncbi:MAG: FliM/FliN family flagellar motor C-terminal domain-containing protein [Pseudomonadota bacterium]
MTQPQEAKSEEYELDRRDQGAANSYRRSIYDVPVTVTVSIGQRRMSISELLDLEADSIVPLTARVDDPVDLTVEDRVIARGELIETEEGQLALKLTEIGEVTDD